MAASTERPTSTRRIINSRLWHLAVSELLGTFLLVSLGLSAAATAALSAPATAQLGSGLALIVALYVTMGASGGHINPAVSTALFVVKRMSLADYFVYQAAQYAGGLLAAALVCCFFYPPLLNFANIDAASAINGGADVNNTETIATTAAAAAAAVAAATHSATEEMEAVYVTHAHQSVSVWRALTSEVFATGSFILAVRGITDSRNAGPPMYLQPPMIAASVLALTQCTAPLSGCALNPARDLPSRIVVAVFQLAVDGDTTGLFSFGGNAGFVAPLLGPYLGAAVGSWLYELLIVRGLPSVEQNFEVMGQQNDDPKSDSLVGENAGQTSVEHQKHPRRRVRTRDTDMSLLSSDSKGADNAV